MIQLDCHIYEWNLITSTHVCSVPKFSVCIFYGVSSSFSNQICRYTGRLARTAQWGVAHLPSSQAVIQVHKSVRAPVYQNRATRVAVQMTEFEAFILKGQVFPNQLAWRWFQIDEEKMAFGRTQAFDLLKTDITGGTSTAACYIYFACVEREGMFHGKSRSRDAFWHTGTTRGRIPLHWN